jgi:hypothetical protein
MDRHDVVLAWAAAARDRREEVVEALTGGRTGLAEVVSMRRDPLVGPIKLVVVTQAVPGVGKVAARRVLARLGLGEHRLAELTDAEAAALLAALPVTPVGGG